MSKRTDLREIQRLTEDAAIDARKLLIQADNLPPDTFQKMLEALCGSFEDTALQLRRLCEQQSPGTGGYNGAAPSVRWRWWAAWNVSASTGFISASIHCCPTAGSSHPHG